MRSIEYLGWEPSKSPLSIELLADLLLQLGWSDSRGILYGSRKGREVRIASLDTRQDEEQEKVGVFVSRIRGEVFLTESDLAFLNRARLDLALVVAGRRAGFFVREPGGSIQTVHSHEEFSAAKEPAPAPAPTKESADSKRGRKWVPVVAFAGLPLAAFAVLPQRAAQAPPSIEIRQLGGSEAGAQLLISWMPAENAVLRIDDGGALVSIPVHSDQSTVTYAARGGPVEVTLESLRNISAHYVVK
jgi:hypothetical protein